jgi:hypothetical protein
MARADFNMVPFNHTFTENAPIKTMPFFIEGNQAPVDDAYLLIQVQGVAENHTIQINDKQIPGVALTRAPGGSQAWRLGMGHIEPGLLHTGQNTISIKRNPTKQDNFMVTWVVVNWREPSST